MKSEMKSEIGNPPDREMSGFPHRVPKGYQLVPAEYRLAGVLVQTLLQETACNPTAYSPLAYPQHFCGGGCAVLSVRHQRVG